MKKTYYLGMMLLLVPVLIWAGYYDGVMTYSCDQLKNALHELISTNTNSNYTAAKLQLFQNVDNHSGSVTCIYTGQNYNISDDYNGSSNPNTEHTYAQSWFSSSESSIKKADIHHLLISTMQVNSARGNLPFEMVISPNATYYSNTPWQSYRGTGSSGQEVFQPAAASRGNVARALLYFYVRYNDSLNQGGVNMLARLMIWHQEDPVDNDEIARNQAIYNYQNNRNPFIDHPEFVNRIWNPTSNLDPEIVPAPAFAISIAGANPFDDELRLNLEADKAMDLELGIYNLRGQLIKTERLRLDPSSSYIWNGKQEDGSPAPSGIYIIQVRGHEGSASIRVLKH